MGSLKIAAEFCLKRLASDRQVSFSIFSMRDVIFRVSLIVNRVYSLQFWRKKITKIALY